MDFLINTMHICGRNHRWTRGDWQISNWIKDKNLNKLSKFKIFDNLRRSVVDANTFLFIIFALYMQLLGINHLVIYGFPILVIIIPQILEILNSIIFKKEIVKQKIYTPIISGIKGSIYRMALNLSFLPYKVYNDLNAIIKTIYRKNISKKNLLEWTTAEDAEKAGKTDLKSYYKLMNINLILGLILLILSFILKDIGWMMLAVGWIIAPCFAWNLSKPIDENKTKLTEKQNEYIKEVGLKTWNFFADCISEKDNFLPPDNYQENRREKIAHRTSPTNIGLGILSIISACDLKFIEKEEAEKLISKILDTIMRLQKWNGHLYNWYNTLTLEPLNPMYVSSVDSGNFICYLFVLKQWLAENNNESKLQNIVNEIINNTNFSYLYNFEKRLFSIGFNIEDNKLTDSYYDLLASEARQTSIIAIAKKDVPVKHWSNLSRTLTILNKYKGLVSWSGTAFEYLMPNIVIKQYPESILFESSKFMIMSQQEYAKQLKIPWGISESAFYLQDLNYNYQYKAFGVPWLGLKRGLADEMVVSPYGSILAMSIVPNDVYNNLKKLESMNMYGEYGFYESIDFTPSRLKYNQQYMPVKTYMAHHQGLILISINNYFNNNLIEKRFSKNPEVEAVDILLQEKMPKDIMLTKEKKEKIEKNKLQTYDNYLEKTYTKTNTEKTYLNIISNDNYTICINDKGEGFSRYKDILINRFKETSDLLQGEIFYIKNIKTKEVVTNIYSNSDKYNVTFSSDATKISKTEKNLDITTKITVSPNDNTEIRRLEIYNNGNEEEVLEVTSFLEPILSKKEADIAHPVFNNLFLSIEYNEDNNTVIVKRKKRDNSSEDIYLGVNLNTEDETIGELEFEIDKEKFLGRNNFGIPKMVEESKPFSKIVRCSNRTCCCTKKNNKNKFKTKNNFRFSNNNIKRKRRDNRKYGKI